MKPLVATFVVLSGLLVCGSSPALAQVPGTACPPLPDSVHGYRLTETRPLEDTMQGVAYRFTGPADERVTVFVYPIPANVRSGEDVQSWVTAEGRKFEGAFPLGVQRGWFQSYRMAFAHPEPVKADSMTVPGFIAAGATKTGDRIGVEIEYLYAVCGRFLKVRGTLDGRTWTDSNFPNFAKALAAQQARP